MKNQKCRITFHGKISYRPSLIQVYNNLKNYSKAEDQRRTRLHEKKEKSTSDLAIDTKTRLILYKMVNNLVLENVYGIISTGKEAVVLYATGGR